MVPMPLNLALIAPERAGRVMTRFPTIRHWIVAGHGLGGVAAGEFARHHDQELAGLMLWAASPGGLTDLSRSALPVLSIFGTADDVTASEDIERSRKLLPPDTDFVPIEGGDHWPFGNFADQQTPESQRARILDVSQSFLEKLSAPQANPNDS